MTDGNLTIGDEIKKNHSFSLYPYKLRVYMNNKNLLFVNYFYGVLKEFWNTNHTLKKPFNEIFFNKVISELIRTNEKLDFITRGWYLYGIEIAKPAIGQPNFNFIPTIEELIKETGFNKNEIEDIESKIKKIALDFDANRDHFYWERKQYTDFKNNIYLIKMDICDAIKEKNIKKINKNLSKLSLHLNSEKINILIGVNVLLNFIDIAKKIILSNEYKIPNIKQFEIAFNENWRCFATVNLYLTSEGKDAEKIKINTSKKIQQVSKNANESNIKISKQIKKEFKIKIKPDTVQKTILKNLGKLNV